MNKLLIAFSLAVSAASAEQLKFQFLSPSFNGVGYSSHVLTIENQETTRKAQRRQEIQAALDKAKADKANTNIAKFLNNLESRIYAQISTNVANAMFAPGASNSGTIAMEGNTISWTKDDSNIYLSVTDIVGNTTQLTIPLGSFTFGVGTP
jgi:hypothetical protein